MNMTKYIAAFMSVCLPICAFGQGRNSFAVIVDETTYNECRTELEAYRDVLDNEGLDAYILHAEWQSPEAVKSQIMKLARKKLEGVVLVGDIPVVMVRGAQFMTTAFKMNEDEYPVFESSVASDRFYDDFDLKFDFIAKDTLHHNVWYYRLSESGSQVLHSDIYSARMLVPGVMQGDKYEIMRRYLRKVVAAHQETNYLDHLIYFAGHAYNSDDLTVWRQKPITLRESFPLAFKASDNNRFLNFREDTYMKHNLFNELQRPATDLFIFSEHGDFDTQYINGAGEANGLGENVDRLKREIVSMYRKYRGTERQEDFLHEVMDSVFHLDRSALSDSLLAVYAAEDSVEAANINISLEDIMRLRSNPRVIIFNACYNGSFHREDGYVAGCHVFGDGRCVVAQGNTVNVLQDKWEDKLIGMLSAGECIGRWQTEIRFLESHLIGDPTYRFAQMPDNLSAGVLERSLDIIAKVESLEGQSNAGKKNKISKTRLADVSQEAYDLFCNDPSWTVRLHALGALGMLSDENTKKAVLKGMDDAYEVIVRTSCNLAAAMGDSIFVQPLESLLERRPDLARVQFAANGAARVCSQGSFDRQIGMAADTTAKEAKRISAMRIFRNSRTHDAIPVLLRIATDSAETEHIRTVAAEVLGWYNLSSARNGIITDLNSYLCKNRKSCPESVRAEIAKTVKRLEHK